MAEIGHLKEVLNVCRRERVIYSTVFKKIESDLRFKEEELKKLIVKNLYT